MIDRFALSLLCIELDRDKTCGVMLLYILLMWPVVQPTASQGKQLVRPVVHNTDDIMALLQQIVSHQIEERRARENDKEEKEERERDKLKREEERFKFLKQLFGEKLVQFSCRIDEVKEENDGGQQQEGNEEREEEGGDMCHEKDG